MRASAMDVGELARMAGSYSAPYDADGPFIGNLDSTPQ
jgi:hypothetical protein